MSRIKSNLLRRCVMILFLPLIFLIGFVEEVLWTTIQEGCSAFRDFWIEFKTAIKDGWKE